MMSVTTSVAQTAAAAKVMEGHTNIHVLLLEGAAAEQSGTQGLLELCGYRVARVSTPAEADAKLRSGSYDLLLAEAELLLGRGVAVRRLLKRSQPVPLLLIQSAEAEHSQVMHGIKLGAADILMRPLCQQKLRTIWLHCVRQELKSLSIKDTKRDQAMADADADAQDLDSIFAACAAQPWGASPPITRTSSEGSPSSSSPRCVLAQGHSLFTDTLDSASAGSKDRGASPAPADASMRAESPPAQPAPAPSGLPLFSLPIPMPAPVKVPTPTASLVPPASFAAAATSAAPSPAVKAAAAAMMAAQPLSMPALAAVLASLPMTPLVKPAASGVSAPSSVLASAAATAAGSSAGVRTPATVSSAAAPASATLATAQSASASVSDASRPKRKSAEILRKPSAPASVSAVPLRKSASTAATSAASLLSSSSSAALSAAMASTMALSGLGGLGMGMGMSLPSYLQPPLPTGQVWGTPINPQAQAPGICPPALPPPTGPVPAWGLMPWMPTSAMSLPGMPSLSSLMSIPFLGGMGAGPMMMPGLFPSPPVLPQVATAASAPAELPALPAATLPAAAAVPTKARSVPVKAAVLKAPAASSAAALAAVPPPPAAPVQPPPAQPLSMMALMQVAASCNSDNAGNDIAVFPRRRSTDAAAAATAVYGAGSTAMANADQLMSLGLSDDDCDLFDFGPEMMAGTRQKVPRFGSQLNLPSLEDLMEPDVQEVMAEVMSYSQHHLSLSSSQVSSAHHLHHGGHSHPAHAYAHTLSAPSEPCTSSGYSVDPAAPATMSDGGYCPPSRHHSMHGGSSDACCASVGFLPRGNSCGLLGGADADTASRSCYLPNVESYDCLSALGDEQAVAEAVAFVGKADDSDGGAFAINADTSSLPEEVDVDAGLDACMSAAAEDDNVMSADVDCHGGMTMDITTVVGCAADLETEEQRCFMKRVDSCSFDACGDVDVFNAGTESDVNAGGHGSNGAGVCGFVGRMDSFTGLGLSLKKSDSLLHLLNGALEMTA